MDILKLIFSSAFIFIVIRVSTPLIFASLSGLVAEKSGITNIGIEGIMLSSALVGVLASAFFKNAYTALLVTCIFGMMMGLLLAVSIINLGANPVLSGLALNMLAQGGTVFVLYLITGDKGISAGINSLVVPNIAIPIIKDIPIIGKILSGHNLLTYLSFISVALIHVVLYKTKFGIRLRSVGENPDAAVSVGIDVNRTRYFALMVSGGLAALGGAFMSMGYLSWFSANMTAGRGFIGLAATTMGMGKPVGVMLASLLFGMTDALANSLFDINVPSQFIQMIPYISTIVGLSFYSYKSSNRKVKKNEKESNN